MNRLRASDYRSLFMGTGLALRCVREEMDAGVFQLLNSGFGVAAPFRTKDAADLAITGVDVVAQVD